MKSESKIKLNNKHSLKAKVKVSQMKNMEVMQHYFIFLSIFFYFCDAISFENICHRFTTKLRLNKSLVKFRVPFLKVLLFD
jgi:hypothetical protein